MKYFTGGFLAAGLMCLGSAAIAQNAQSTADAPTQVAPTPIPNNSPNSATNTSATSGKTVPSSDSSKHQMMKECMTRQAAKNDGSSKMQMKKACKDEMTSSTDTSTTK
jgi:hypothetical protein